MATPNSTAISETIPLLRHAEQRPGDWVPFVVDDVRQFKRAIRWLISDPDSPLGYVVDGKPTKKVLVEWRGADGAWSSVIRIADVRRGEISRGRLRFRRSYTRKARA